MNPPPPASRMDASASRKAMAELVERLEQVVTSSLGSLAEGTRPLLDVLREGAKALEPGPGGARLSPKEREAWGVQLEATLERLEDVLEGLQLAARAKAGGKRD
ncbi:MULTISPECIES: hypothetical protein [Myxococcus]|uniref:hypothetical protein n=1 Tax=Myxococcus TaxID=32 RepID=UPI001F07CFF9|nr:hypothetical protein [Myxococcus eversor]